MIFRKSVLLKSDQEQLFNFHLDTRNALKISPPFPFLELMHISDIPLKESSTLTMRLKFILFSIDWSLTISEVKKFSVVTDTQLSGPVYKWLHHHRFETCDEGIIMTDEVEFQSVKSNWLSCVTDPFVYVGLLGLFVFRHQAMKKLFRD